MTPTRPGNVKEVFLSFLRIGALGFGGPIAMLGYMETHFIQRSNWISLPQFQRMIAVAKLFPGPITTLVSIRMGLERAGILGGMAAGAGLILPAFFMILILAKTVTTLDAYPVFSPLWVGLSLAAIAISLQATVKLTKPLFSTSPFKKSTLILIIALNLILTFYFAKYEALFILSCGALALLHHQKFRANRTREVASLAFLFLLFWTCFRASLFTFGSGIAIVPVLRTFFIDEHHWVTAPEFLRGLTLGQITPGPLVIVSTYLGFTTAGVCGAIVTTIGTFLPTFIFGLWVMPKFESTLLQSPQLKSFFDGLLPAVCGAIFGAMVRLLIISSTENEMLRPERLIFAAALTGAALRWNLSPLPVFAIGGVAAYLMP